MVEIIVNNSALELYKGTGIKYSIQNSDFFDVANLKASYTNSFNIPKTPNNTNIFEGLGLIGDTSNIPYTKTEVYVKYYGFDVIAKGWLDVKETAEDYKINIIDGIIDFFKDVEKKKIGTDLDLSALRHQKTTQSITDSFTNYSYRYILADYAGKTLTDAGNINADYLIPCVRFKYLFDNIFSTFGYTYQGAIFSQEDFNDLWLSYNKEIPSTDDETLTQYAELIENNFTQTKARTSIGPIYFREPLSWDTSTVVQGQVLGSRYVVPEAGNYRVDLFLKGRGLGAVKIGTTTYGGPIYRSYSDYYRVKIFRNSEEVGFALSDVNTERETPIYVSLQQGDVLDFKFYLETTRAYDLLIFYNRGSRVVINKTNAGAVDFEEALKDFSVKDFFKEICLRFGLITDYHARTKTINFYQMKDVLNKSNALDWSHRYIKRKKEGYAYSSFAQVNSFRHKYNDENLSYNDGFLYTENKNLEEEKTIFVSKLYSADREVKDLLGRPTQALPCFTAEVKEEAGEIKVDYKTLSGRTYALKDQRIEESVTIESEAFTEQLTRTGYPLVKLQDNFFVQLISKYYSEHERVLKDLRVHEIELALGLEDILNIDLKRLYYFEQEKQYYFLNKITWDMGSTCTGEFIRVK
jgi:hypothetical protein